MAVIAGLATPPNAEPAVDPADTARAIRAAADLRSRENGARALPLAAVWNPGWTPEGYTPEVQVKMIRKGHHILPTLYLPVPGGENQDRGYYARALTELRRLRLPLALKSTQWESVLLSDTQSVLSSRACVPGWFALKSERCLSPFGPLAAWEDAGTLWGSTALLEELQRLYPDPPLVILLSNNEAPRLPWTGVPSARRHQPDEAGPADAVAIRALAGRSWAQRERALQSGFRKAIGNASWSANAVFVGYNAFGPGFIGRWPGWADRALADRSDMAPEASGWDGASVPFYVNVGDPSSDHSVWGPQVAAMNWVPMRAQVERRAPEFWFELSTWDGALPGDPRDKPGLYRRRGQQTPPARYRGLVQFGMWLLRPRVVREYRGYLERRSQTDHYFHEIVRAVDRVHSDRTLSEFWRHGALVANDERPHPYNAALPAWFDDVQRWFLLDTDQDPSRPWHLDTQIEVFSLALVLGELGSRRWLVYAHAPLGDREEVRIAIPDFRPIRLRVTVGGTFVLVHEQTGAVDPL